MAIDPVLAGAGVIDLPGMPLIPTGYVLGNDSGVDAFPYAILGGGGSSSLTVGTTTIARGTTTCVFYDNAGVLGEYAVSGTGNVAMTTNGVFTTPNLGTPSALVLTNATGTPNAIGLANGTGLPLATGISGFGTGIATALGVNIGSAGAPVLFNGAGGTPSSLALTNATGLPVGSITGLGTGVATALAINVGSAGAPVLFNGAGGTPSSLALTNATGLPVGSLTGLGTGVATALAINVGSAGAPVLFNGAGGTPSSLALTNATGAVVAGGGTGAASFTAYGPIFGGTTSTGALQSAALGTSGWVLTSNGAGVLPSFQAAAAGGGLTIGTSTITSGTGGRILWNNAGVVGETVGASYSSTTQTLTLTPTGNNSALVLTGGTITADAPVLNMTQTWNNGAINFTGIKLNVTRTASAGSDFLMDLQLGGTSNFSVDRTGVAQSKSTLIGKGGVQVGTVLGNIIQFGTTGTVIGDNSTDGQLVLSNNAGNNFGRIIFGAVSTSFPALKRSSTALQARLADDSAFTFMQGKLQTDNAYAAATLVATGSVTMYDSTGTAYRVLCLV